MLWSIIVAITSVCVTMTAANANIDSKGYDQCLCASKLTTFARKNRLHLWFLLVPMPLLFLLSTNACVTVRVSSPAITTPVTILRMAYHHHWRQRYCIDAVMFMFLVLWFALSVLLL